jgi:hypothetical protein
MAKVENVQETVEEPTPNPYNAKKPWHTEDVMPKEGLTADSLFVAPRPEKDEGDQQIEKQTVTQDKPYSQPNYKKRYDDLKKHYDTKLNEFRAREQELANKVQQAQPVYEAPKSLEELERFKSEYPDVYEVVESVAHLKSEDKIKGLTDKVALIEAREQDIMRREAEKDLMEKHPDYSDLRNNDDFHNWAETQPEEIQDWIYNNPNNASLASKAIDLYKMEVGSSTSVRQQKPSSNRQAQASEMVSTKTTSVEAKEPKIWTQEEIAALPMDEFDRLESEIDRALEEGRVRN